MLLINDNDVNITTPTPKNKEYLARGVWNLCWNKVDDLRRAQNDWNNNALPLSVALFMECGAWMRANTSRITDDRADLIVCEAPLVGPRRANWIAGPPTHYHAIHFNGPKTVRFGKHDAEQELGYAMVLKANRQPLMFLRLAPGNALTSGKPFTLQVGQNDRTGNYGAVNA